MTLQRIPYAKLKVHGNAAMFGTDGKARKKFMNLHPESEIGVQTSHWNKGNPLKKENASLRSFPDW